jgi:hypothetical protein
MDEQIDFVADLSNANIPSTDVARVMERMRTRQRRVASTRGVGSIGDMNPGIAPPSYDDIDSQGFSSASSRVQVV